MLDTPGGLIGSGNFTFTAGSSFTLEASTSYWLDVRSVPVDGVAFLWDGTTPSTMPSGIATAIGYNFNGASSSFFNRLQINGTAVPGPAALAVLGLGLLGVRSRRRG